MVGTSHLSASWNCRGTLISCQSQTQKPNLPAIHGYRLNREIPLCRNIGHRLKSKPSSRITSRCGKRIFAAWNIIKQSTTGCCEKSFRHALAVQSKRNIKTLALFSGTSDTHTSTATSRCQGIRPCCERLSRGDSPEPLS